MPADADMLPGDDAVPLAVPEAPLVVPDAPAVEPDPLAVPAAEVPGDVAPVEEVEPLVPYDEPAPAAPAALCVAFVRVQLSSEP